jgi:hypothetical protein
VTAGGSFTNLERLVSDVLGALAGACTLEGWSSPFPTKAGEAAALACRITVAVPARITGGF